MKNKFDEHQFRVRGNIFLRIVIYYVVLLLANAWLADNGIVWAGGFYTNILILMLPIAIGSVEMILRGVYFPLQNRGIWIIAILGLASLAGLILTVIDMIKGEALVTGGALTDTGCQLAVTLCVLLIALCGIIKWLAMRRRVKNTAEK